MSFEVELAKEYFNSLTTEKKQVLFEELINSLNKKEKLELINMLMPMIITELKELPEKTRKKLIQVLK